MRRILFLAYYFPPIAASGSMRPAGFCSHLPSLDYEPLVLTTEYRDVHPPIAIDESLESLISSNLEIHRVRHINWQKNLLTFREFVRSRMKAGKLRAPSEGLIAEPERDKSSNLKDLKAAVLDRVFRFPDQQKSWGSAAVAYARRIPQEHRPNIVLATGSPWSGLVAGAKIAEFYDVPFVADFRDPWTRNPKPPLSASLGRKAEKLEATIFKKASRVIANTAELAETFAEQYPEYARKIVVITNGFHESLGEKLQRLPDFQQHGERIELSYFGSVYELRRPTDLLLALKSLLDDQYPGSDRLLLRFTGNWIVTDRYCNALAEELGARGALIREPNLNHENYLRQLKASQYLLILQQAFPLQIPGKIYEYMASGRPIVVIGGAGATANLVNNAKLGLVCGNTCDEITTMLKALIDTNTSIEAPNPDLIKRFSYPNLSQQLVDTLDEALAEHD